MNYEVMLGDFDGVWSSDRFYMSLACSHPQAYAYIESRIWGSGSHGRADQWMRGDLTMHEINRLISSETDIDPGILTATLLADAACMSIETGHIPIVLEMKQRGIKVGMVTNNMDTFNQAIRPRLHLDELFDGAVVNSFDHHRLKTEGLFDVAMHILGHTNYSTSLLIDDSPKARAAFEARGGQTYAYTSFDTFRSWIGLHFPV